MKSLNTCYAKCHLKKIGKKPFDDNKELQERLEGPDITYYQDLCKISQELVRNYPDEAVFIISHIAYGWMQTVLSRFNEDKNSDNLEIILDAINKKDRDGGIELISSMHPDSPINNSWIGLSKVLHFINPSIFPIWDSRVAGKFKISSDGPRAKFKYLDYFEFIHSNVELEIVNEFHEYLKSRDIVFSKVRTLEFLLYATEDQNECEDCD